MNTSSTDAGGGGGQSTNTGRPESYGSSQQSSRNEPTNQRFSSFIHDSEVFLTKLREFKPQSLGCLEARRKSSSTLIFPSPPQACMGPPKCPRHPHNVKPTPGYWIECHGPGPAAPSSSATATGNKSASIYVSAQQQQQQTMMSDIVASKGASLDDQKSASLAGNVASHSCSGSFEHAGVERESSIKHGSSEGCRAHAVALCVAAAAAGHNQAIGEKSLSRHGIDSPDESGDIMMQNVSTAKGQCHRQQSLDTTYELNLELSQQQQQHKDSVIAASHEPHPVIGIRSSSGGAGSSPEVTALSAGTGNIAQSPPEGKQNLDMAASTTSGSEMRKRLNKRTMTRDDIDLHKARRGTPNITITEPSFNQSTTTYHHQHHPMRHDSRDGSRPLSRVAVSSATTGNASGVGSAAAGRQPIKFRVQRYVSDNKKKDDESRFIPMDSQEGAETTIQIGGQVELIDTNASKSQTILPQSHEQQQRSSASSLSRQQSHRPSVIREDADTDSSTGAMDEQKEFYCGLSTVAFNKKPYQQSGQGQTDLSQFKDSSLELISFEEENYEKHYYGREHWNYFTNDELLGPVMLSLKQEVNNQRDHFHVLLRTVSYTLHGTIPASTICADRYDREAIVRELSEIAKLKPPLMLGQLPSTPDELLKLDHIFIKTELKVGVIYIKSGQAESEEAILGNRGESELFNEFLDLLGDRITLKGFDRYKGGLDTVHNLTGTESVYTMWRGIEIMFHVSTMLPHEENDPQKLQKKRHIGNDIVCVAFIESDDTLFWPGCIKSYFLHTFIAVQTSPKPVKEGEKRKYTVSCVCRNEVQYAFRPYLIEQDEFFKSDYFREWLLVKIVNGERASYSAPKFARMQDRTRSQLLEDIITNLANHLVTGQIPKPYRRGSWRPLGHTRASSPLEDSMKDYFEDYDQLAKDFCQAFCGPSRSMLCDVVFRVRDTDGSYKLVHGVRAIMAIRSRTFLEMLYGFVPPGTSSLQNQTSLRAIEIKALSGESSGASGTSKGGGSEASEHPHLLVKRGSVGTEGGKRMGEKERRQSMLPNLSKSTTSKPNYLTVPSSGSGGGGGASAGSGTGGMIKNAFNRLVSGNWSGWSGNIRSYKGEPMHIKVDQNKTKVDLNSLAICKEIAKIDADKLAQREFEIKEFDYETFQQTIEYIHNGQCKLSYETIPGLICAAEHYDLPDLLHACFHHANTHMRLNAAPKMMNALYQNSCFYMTAMQLLDSIYEFIDPTGAEFLSRSEYLELNESVLTNLLSRKTLQVSELKKFQAMDGWAKHQIANKQKQKLEVKKQQSSEIPDQIKSEGSGDNTIVTGKNTSEMDVDSHEQHQQQPQQQPQQQQQQQQQQSQPQPQPQQHEHEQLQQQQQQPPQQQQPSTAQNTEEMEHEYRALMTRLNKEVNIKLDKISNEDLVKVVLPTKVFSNDKIFEVMADESRNDY